MRLLQVVVSTQPSELAFAYCMYVYKIYFENWVKIPYFIKFFAQNHVILTKIGQKYYMYLKLDYSRMQ